MAFKFNEISFDLKDIMLIVGIVMYFNRSEQRQAAQFNELKTEIAKIISDNKINEVKVNARFDALINKPTKETSDKSTYKPLMIAVTNDYQLKIKRKKLFNFKLI